MAQHRLGYINNFGIQGILKRDEENKVTNSDAFAQIEWKFAPRWSTTAGLRYSNVRFTSSDYFTANGNDSGAVSYSKTTPVAGVLFNLTPAVNVYANIGRGFETPTLIESAVQPGRRRLQLRAAALDQPHQGNRRQSQNRQLCARQPGALPGQHRKRNRRRHSDRRPHDEQERAANLSQRRRAVGRKLPGRRLRSVPGVHLARCRVHAAV